MKKASRESKSPAESAKRKVAIKDLKAKDAGSVKGGALLLKFDDVTAESRDDKHKDEITL